MKFVVEAVPGEAIEHEVATNRALGQDFPCHRGVDD